MKRKSVSHESSRLPAALNTESLTSLLEWDDTFYQAVAAASPAFREELAQAAKLNYVITESYAGTAAGTHVFKRAINKVKSEFGYPGVELPTWSVIEKGKIQSELLQSMASHCKPLHQFHDVTHVVPILEREACEGIVDSIFTRLSDLKLLFASDVDGLLTVEEFEADKQELGQELFMQLDVVLSKSEILEQAECST